MWSENNHTWEPENGEHDRHDRRTTFLAIRLDYVIYTGSGWRGSSTCKKQAVCVKD